MRHRRISHQSRRLVPPDAAGPQYSWKRVRQAEQAKEAQLAKGMQDLLALYRRMATRMEDMERRLRRLEADGEHFQGIAPSRWRLDRWLSRSPRRSRASSSAFSYLTSSVMVCPGFTSSPVLRP